MTEAELLFTELFKCNRTSLYLERKRRLDKDITLAISKVLQRRLFGEPIQYILAKTEFMGLEFKVEESVFIPRPDTEILVETVISVFGFWSLVFGGKGQECRILEIGTGSGCIAVSLAKFLPEAKIFATDISWPALKVARENARLNNVAERIKFIQSNLFVGLGVCRFDGYDIIVSNPPYIPRVEIDKLAPEIQYEPCIALDGGEDGLDFYRRIIRESPLFLRKGSFLIMEMGWDQCEAIKEIFKLCKKFQVKEVVKDYNGVDRVIVAQLRAYSS